MQQKVTSSTQESAVQIFDYLLEACGAGLLLDLVEKLNGPNGPEWQEKLRRLLAEDE